MIELALGDTAAAHADLIRARAANRRFSPLDIPVLRTALTRLGCVMMARLTAAAVLLTGVLAAVLIPAAPAHAHPLGNFSINQLDALDLYPDRVRGDRDRGPGRAADPAGTGNGGRGRRRHGQRRRARRHTPGAAALNWPPGSRSR